MNCVDGMRDRAEMGETRRRGRPYFYEMLTEVVENDEVIQFTSI